MTRRTRVLVTCVGSGVGQSVVDSLRARKDDYFLVGSDRNRYCYSVPDCDDFVPLPAIDDAGYIDALLGACAALRIDALVPGHDMELALVARHRARFEAAGTRPIVADEPLVTLLRDKRAWSAEFSRHTPRVAPAWSPDEYRRAAAEGRAPLPAIAKPTGGSASTGLRILRRTGDAAGLGEDFVIQPFLFPVEADPEAASIRAAVAAGRVMQASEVSVQLAYGRGGELLGRFASRNRLKAGVPVEFHPLDDPALWSAVDEVRAVLERYSPAGPVNLQGRVTDEGPVFFEMNPRFTGITGNRALFGFNEVALLVDNFTGGERRRLRASRRKVGVRQVACRAWPAERFAFGQGAGSDAGPLSIVVLGATSWLARHFIAARSARGDTVTAVVRASSLAAAARAHGGRAGVELVEVDSRELPDCLAAADVVVNCLSARPPHGNAAMVEGHVRQLRLLECAEAVDVPFVVNVSSQSVYGAGSDRRESAALDAPDAYAFSKVAIEEALRGMSRRKPSTAGVSLRLGRLFGPAEGLRPQEFPHAVVARALDGAAVDVRGPGNTLDLLDIRDAVRALEFFVERRSGEWRGEAFNVGTGTAVTVGDYVAMADRLCRERLSRPLQAPLGATGGAARPPLDCSRLTALGWRPQYALERSLSDLFEFMRHAS